MPLKCREHTFLPSIAYKGEGVGEEENSGKKNGGAGPDSLRSPLPTPLNTHATQAIPSRERE